MPQFCRSLLESFIADRLTQHFSKSGLQTPGSPRDPFVGLKGRHVFHYNTMMWFAFATVLTFALILWKRWRSHLPVLLHKARQQHQAVVTVCFIATQKKKKERKSKGGRKKERRKAGRKGRRKRGVKKSLFQLGISLVGSKSYWFHFILTLKYMSF